MEERQNIQDHKGLTHVGILRKKSWKVLPVWGEQKKHYQKLGYCTQSMVQEHIKHTLDNGLTVHVKLNEVTETVAASCSDCRECHYFWLVPYDDLVNDGSRETHRRREMHGFCKACQHHGVGDDHARYA
jgi:hypothetical protein